MGICIHVNVYVVCNMYITINYVQINYIHTTTYMWQIPIERMAVVAFYVEFFLLSHDIVLFLTHAILYGSPIPQWTKPRNRSVGSIQANPASLGDQSKSCLAGTSKQWMVSTGKTMYINHQQRGTQIYIYIYIMYIYICIHIHICLYMLILCLYCAYIVLILHMYG